MSEKLNVHNQGQTDHITATEEQRDREKEKYKYKYKTKKRTSD